jgi:hypothetical protein
MVTLKLRLSFAVALAAIATIPMVISQSSASATTDVPAAAAFAHIDPSGFTLDPGESFAQLGPLVTALETDSRIHKVSLNTLLTTTTPGRTATWPLCHTTHLDSAYSPSGFCWDSQDDTTTDWYPQGITGSGDADPSGLVDGRRLVAASWHGPKDDYARVSIADYTKPSASVLYHHLLLVRPVTDADGTVNYTQVTAHADGLMWLGSVSKS